MKVLFISSSRLGDAILSTSVLHYLEKHYKHLEVTVACGKLPAPLFKSIPFCKEVHILEKKSYSRHWYDLWKTYRGERFDKIIDLRGSLVSHVLQAKTRHIWQSHQAPALHQVERLGAFLGLDQPLPPKLWIDKESLKEAKATFPPEFLAVAPAANWIGKQWPQERFTDLLKQFQSAFSHAHVVLFGAPHEASLVQGIAGALHVPRTHCLLTHNLHDVTATLSLAHIFIGNDSGLMHMAAAHGIPTIGLFGPSCDVRYGPYGQDHVIMRGQSLREIEKLPHFSYHSKECYMQAISVEDVVESLFNLWREQSDHALHTQSRCCQS